MAHHRLACPQART